MVRTLADEVTERLATAADVVLVPHELDWLLLHLVVGAGKVMLLLVGGLDVVEQNGWML